MVSAIVGVTVATVNGRKNFNQHLKKLSPRNWIEELIQKASTRRAAAFSSGLLDTNHRFFIIFLLRKHIIYTFPLCTFPLFMRSIVKGALRRINVVFDRCKSLYIGMYVAHYSTATAFISCVQLNAVHHNYFAGPRNVCATRLAPLLSPISSRHI